MLECLLVLALAGNAPTPPKSPEVASPETPEIPSPAEPAVAHPAKAAPGPSAAAETHPVPTATNPETADVGVTAETSASVLPGGTTGREGTPKKAAGKRRSAEDEHDEQKSGLAARQLCAELSRNGKSLAAQRARLEEEKKTIASERERLEKLAADIEHARTQLREETARLEALVEKGAPRRAEAPEAPSEEEAKPVAAKRKAVSTKDAKPKGEYEGLAKTMKAMKPEQAAVLVARLDRKLAAELLRRMRPAEAGAVIEKLKPDLAAELLGAMAAGGSEGKSK